MKVGVQNEFLSIIVLQVLCKIADRLQAAMFYVLMVDETTDKANKE